jgi:hypothetical protein
VAVGVQCCNCQLLALEGELKMLLEVAKPATFVFCIVSLYSVFYTAFLDPANDLEQRICESLILLMVAAGVSLISGFIFREATNGPPSSSPPVTATLPVQMFMWATGIMLVLFIVARYLESHCIFYRDVRAF